MDRRRQQDQDLNEKVDNFIQRGHSHIRRLLVQAADTLFKGTQELIDDHHLRGNLDSEKTPRAELDSSFEETNAEPQPDPTPDENQDQTRSYFCCM